MITEPQGIVTCETFYRKYKRERQKYQLTKKFDKIEPIIKL